MEEYKHTKSFSKLPDLLQKIRSTGVPNKAGNEWLGALGYSSSNDRSLPPILKTLGFIDQKNVPTQRWQEYRGENNRAVLGQALKEAYSELFNLYSS